MERLTNLVALLLETNQPLSLVEIAGELGQMYPHGASARRGAFERDKAVLRDIGIPIESEIVAGGTYAGQTRYWIDRDRYELSGLDLEPEEQRALQVAVAATRGDSSWAQEALWKLGAGVVEETSAVAVTLPSSPELATLREAVAARAVVGFRYRDIDREVEPWGLLLREGFWYLVGFDRGRDAQRTYRVDRIEGAVTVGAAGAFERPSIELRSVLPADPKTLSVGDEDAGDEPAEAVVRVRQPRAGLVERELGHERVIGRGDETIDVLVPCRNLVAFRSWVLGLGEFAEVRSPDVARAAVVEWLDRLVAR